MILFSCSLSVFQYIEAITEQMLLATVYGGVLLGIGVGIVIHSGGCVDGTESVALVISKKSSLSVGQVVLLFNLVIYGVAGLIFGLDRAMYSLLTYFITFKVIDLVSEGFEQLKAAFIVTEKVQIWLKKFINVLVVLLLLFAGKGLLVVIRKLCIVFLLELRYMSFVILQKRWMRVHLLPFRCV